MNFHQKFDSIVNKNNSLLCVGLDPDLEKFPSSLPKRITNIFEFNKTIIDATHDLVCVYKPNIAFYEAEGIEGIIQLKKTIDYLKNNYPDIPIVLDAKRGDIGNTARMYAASAYKYWGVDAVTVYPHLGLDSLEPFFEYKDKLTILLIKTSNRDSGVFQNALVNQKPYYLHMAETIKSWNKNNAGIFVGATYPKELQQVRSIFPQSIFLSAGLGAQEGTVEQAVKAGIDRDKKGIMFNVSRSILYASSASDFVEKAREEAIKTRDEINKYRV